MRTKILQENPPGKILQNVYNKIPDNFRQAEEVQKNLRAQERIFPGAHKIGTAISGPRIADNTFYGHEDLSERSPHFCGEKAHIKILQENPPSKIYTTKIPDNVRQEITFEAIFLLPQKLFLFISEVILL